VRKYLIKNGNKKKVEGWQRHWAEETKKKWSDETYSSQNQKQNESETPNGNAMPVGITSIEKKKIVKKELEPETGTSKPKPKEKEAYCFMCDKPFANATVLKHHMSSKKCVDKKNMALLECKVQLFSELLEENLIATRDYLDKKQTMTYAEIRREMLENANENVNVSENIQLPSNEEDVMENLNPKKKCSFRF